MDPDPPTNEALLRAELAESRTRLEQAEEALHAIRSGEVDALVVQGASGPQIFTLEGLDAESNRFRGGILAQVSDAVIAIDSDQRITYLNAAAETQYGLESSEALGRHLSELYESRWLHPGDEVAARSALLMRGEWRGENMHITRDGRELCVESSITTMRDRDGSSIGLLAAIRDITERKRTEEALHASDERFRVMANAITQLAWIARPDGYIFWYNDRWYDYTGTTPEQMEGWGWQSVHDPAELPKVLERWRECIATGQPFEMTFPLRGADGNFRQFLTRGIPLKDADGKVVNWFGTNTDVDEITRTEAALRESNQRMLLAIEAAEAANHSKDRFLAVLSHELRTPLTPVLMTVGALEHDPRLRADVREDMAMIRRNIELETKLIDDLLDLNRITSGKLRLDVERVDLNEVVRHVCDMCRRQVTDRGVRLDLHLAEDAGCVTADPARLQQVLWNVLKNSIKFTPKPGSISVSTRRIDSERCEVRVQDNGMGIAADVLPRIFNAFEQGDPSVTRQFGGLGLGLAICKALVELHHGAIRAESPGTGQGSTFIIELPAATVADVAKSTPAPSELNGAASPLRLLVVEDHIDTARILARILRDAGFAVLTASDVAEATAIVQRETFDVLVSDLGLPDGSGFDVMKAVRGSRRIPGIAMSGYGMDEDLRRSREAGFTEHLVKPVEPAQLIAAIRRVTDNRV